MWRGEGYFSNYERYFNDVFGFRNFFIRVRNQIQYSLFSDADQVIIGRDGWVADKGAVETEQPNVDALNEAQWARLSIRFSALKRILNARGIYLIVIPIPFKNTVYPENFPDQAARRPQVTGEARFRKLLTDDGVPFVDVYNLLVPRKYPVPLYYRTDIHWNNLGATIAATSLVDQLGAALRVRVRARFPNDYTYRTFTDGDEGGSLAIFWSPTDTEPAAAWNTAACGSFVPRGEGAVFTNTCGERCCRPR